MAFNRILYSDLAIAKSDGLSVSLYIDGQVFIGDVKALEVDGVVTNRDSQLYKRDCN